MNRSQFLFQLTKRILRIERSHPTRVAIDGIDAAGKTILADELAPLLAARHRPVVRASMDGFHYPRAFRHRQGADSPVGYFEDSFNLAAVIHCLLKPLGPGGNRVVRTAVFDHLTDSPLDTPPAQVSNSAILLFDGVFLMRPELRDYWDFTVFLDVRFAESLARAMTRDKTLLGTVVGIKQRYEQRYIPGQRLYLQTCRPKRLADVVVNNNNPLKPKFVNQK